MSELPFAGFDRDRLKNSWARYCAAAVWIGCGVTM
jgi:hypothetical protein